MANTSDDDDFDARFPQLADRESLDDKQLIQVYTQALHQLRSALDDPEPRDTRA